MVLNNEVGKMKNLLHNLKTLLQKDERLVSEGELLKNKIIELALKLDKDLIKLLLSDKEMKKVFFADVDPKNSAKAEHGAGETLIFDKDKFIRFVSNKQFLPDSYTSFKNKIGLTVGDEYISEKKEVVISWPYKDCVLEGGMTKEDQKRNEIFWNETLAPDEISRLFDPKVFTNAKRIDKNGESSLCHSRESGNLFRTNEKGEIKDNLIIKGNNLLALHSLKKRFAGKVKLIYIDPPYNTGNDEFKYNDAFNHSTWLTFMKNRLEVAKELLKDDGVIFVQIDFNEHGYLKILCDEIFGRDNFVNEIVWKRRGGKTSPDTNRLENVCDYILLYRKRDQFEIKFLYTKADSEKYIESQFKYQDSGSRRYRLSPLNAPQYRPTLVYDFMGYKPHHNGWSVTKDRLQELYEQGKLVFPKDKNGRVNRKQYLDEWEGYAINSLWIDITSIAGASKERTGMMRGQKPEKLIKRVLELGSNDGDIILDFFLGSGTTCAVAHKMGRQYIGVEQLDYGKNSAEVRLKKVINGDQSGISKSVGWKGGGDFVYLELMKWNENFVEKIQKAKTKGDLKKLWKTMKETAFLSYKVDIKAVDKNAKDFADLSIEDQKKFLLECLDKNHLYVNYSDIDDEEYGVSEEDKKLNREFYRG